MAKKTTAQRDAEAALDAAKDAAKDAKKLIKSLPKKTAKKLKPLVDDAKDASKVSKKEVAAKPKKVTKSATAATERLQEATARLKPKDKGGKSKDTTVEKAPAIKSAAAVRPESMAPSPAVTQNLAALTIIELRARARAAGRTGYSRLSKAALIDFLAH